MTYTMTEETIGEEYASDTVPVTFDVEYPCVVCGHEAGPYGGRGRKPKFCPDHKKNQAKSTGPRVKGVNASLAAQATEALIQGNQLATFLVTLAGFYGTASAMSAPERTDMFREQTYNALITDPDLCRQLLKAGSTSAKFSLMLAYLMYGASIAPVAIEEYREKAAQRVRDREADES